MSRSGDDDTATGSADALNQILAGLTGDPAKLTKMLLKNLLENQKKPRQFNRLDECPTKGSYTSLDAWLEEVELWDETNKNCDGDIANLSAKKYLKFID